MEQLTAFNYNSPVFDRNGKPICLGDRIRVKRCIGRYGQTVTEEGVVVEQSPREDQKTQTSFGQLAYRDKNGSLQYAAVEFDRATKRGVCYHKHNDFEHGHERWVEVLTEENQT